PEHVGKYAIQFSLRVDKTNVLSSRQISINVMADQPIKLVPDSQPPTPVVSYSNVISSRFLVENITLRTTDSYGNAAGQGLDGKVNVSVKDSTGDNQNLPLFEATPAAFSLKIYQLFLSCWLQCHEAHKFNQSYLPVQMFILECVLCLSFSVSDVQNQQRMSEITRKRDVLTTAVSTYKEMFTTYKYLLELLTNVNSHLIFHTLHIYWEITDVVRLLTQKNAEVERILNIPRQVCTISNPFRGQQDVLGMVGHLALVQNDAEVWVVSWHMPGKMDCVITRTTATGRRIYDDTQRSQQVMALDSVYCLFQIACSPLTHTRDGNKIFDPPGNPVFARELLIYPQDQRSCNIVFKNMLGDTIVMDDLDSASWYRKMNKIPCPTILTRQGDRITPFPKQCDTLREQIDRLSQYHLTQQKRDKAVKEHDEHLRKMKSPEMLAKQQEMMEKEKQLEEIEGHSGMLVGLAEYISCFLLHFFFSMDDLSVFCFCSVNRSENGETGS
uniref:SMC hinge domain-containing protein n=1 Tax=Mola mola TaxID=94237 RepID=A0A3Q3VPC8_MOLML